MSCPIPPPADVETESHPATGTDGRTRLHNTGWAAAEDSADRHPRTVLRTRFLLAVGRSGLVGAAVVGAALSRSPLQLLLDLDRKREHERELGDELVDMADHRDGRLIRTAS